MSKSNPQSGNSVYFGTESVYKWECPVCDASNIGTAETDTPITSGLQALQSHIRAKKGDGHGPQYAIPEKWGDERLEQYVKAADQ